MRPACLGMLPILLLTACEGGGGELALRRENALLRAQLQQARDEAHGNRRACEKLAAEHDKALLSVRQLRADTQYLTASTMRLSDAVTRLNYDDWNTVVPEVQLSFGDVESAANDLDSRVGRVLIAFNADSR